MIPMRKHCWFVYWLYSDHGTDPERHGYVGVTSSLFRRIWFHHCRDFPAFKVKILLRSTQEQCHAMERRLRPYENIGWNKRAGGPTYIGERGRSNPKSPEHRAKIREAALQRYENPKQHELTSVSVKKGLPKNHSKGANNPMFGRKMSEETKQKIRDKIKDRSSVSLRSFQKTT
jgi:hypothetical protein